MAKKPRKPRTTVRWVNPPDREALLALARALARAGARIDAEAEAVDWRKRPRKRVLKPKGGD